MDQLQTSEPRSGSKLSSSHVEVLMNAARTGNDYTILKLISKRLDLSATDEDGNTALHVAAMNGHHMVCRLLIVFSAPVELWTIRNNEGLTAEDLATTDQIRSDFHEIQHHMPRKDDVHSKENDMLLSAMKSWPENGKVLLAMDGGGIKALIMLQVLIHLDHLTEGGIMDRIDWIGGTSCGGIVSLFIGKGMSFKNIKHTFFDMKNKIFCGNTEKFPKHDCTSVELNAQEQFGVQTRMDTMKKKVMVTVADSRKSPPTLLLFRSYAPNVPKDVCESHDYLDPNRILVWKAARCTSAAPFFFESYNGLSDGGLVANNPTQILMTDFFNVSKIERHYNKSSRAADKEKEDKIGVVISLGTGFHPPEKTNGIDLNWKNFDKKNPLQLAKSVMSVMSTAKTTFQLLVKEVTSSNGTPVRYSRAWCHSLNVPYFRFSPSLNKEVPLDSTDPNILVDMLWDTELYIRGVAKQELQQLARLLEMKPLPEKEDVKTATTTATTNRTTNSMEAASSY